MHLMLKIQVKYAKNPASNAKRLATYLLSTYQSETRFKLLFLDVDSYSIERV